MELIRLLIIAVCAVVALAQGSGNSTGVCNKGYWGKGCVNYCGYCHTETPTTGVYDRECDPVTGGCSEGCQGGWTGTNCDVAYCEDGCNGGECIAPGVCGNCPDISHVSPGCTNLKLRGLLGSLTAFIVLICSLIACGLGTMFYERRKNTGVSL